MQMKSLCENGRQTMNLFSRFLFHSRKMHWKKIDFFLENKIRKGKPLYPRNGVETRLRTKINPRKRSLISRLAIGEGKKEKVKRSCALGID